MKIIAISGSGVGAGKSWLANRLSDVVFSLADEIRDELAGEYMADFYDKSQAGKLKKVAGTDKTVRELLIERGQDRRKANQNHWIDAAINHIVHFAVDAALYLTISIDDIRFLNEINRLRERFGDYLLHIHIEADNTVHEEGYENEELAKVADTIVTRRAK